MKATPDLRTALLALLVGGELEADPDLDQVLGAVIDDLRQAPPVDVAIACIELVKDLVRELAQSTSQSRDDILQRLSLDLAKRP